MLKMEMLPAEFGDCLWIEYGSAAKPKRILIDAGTPGSFPAVRTRIEQMPQGDREFELLVITHVDADHIGGVLKVIENRKKLGISFKDIWFNGWKHLEESTQDLLGPVQGEQLTVMLSQGLPWNKAFDTKAVIVPEEGPLPVREFAGMKLTLLSPKRAQLTRLMPVWEEAVRNAGLVPGSPIVRDPAVPEDDTLGPLNVEALANEVFKTDKAEANGSSIAMLAEFDGKVILLGADAYATVMLESLNRLTKKPSQKVDVDVLKLAHHGSKGNVSSEFLQKLKCKRFFLSTNGKRFRHPDKQAVARVIRLGGTNPQLYFNYKTKFNDMWASEELMQDHNYESHFPKAGSTGIAVDL